MPFNHYMRYVKMLEPRYNEGPGDWLNQFTIKRFPYIKVLFVCYTEALVIEDRYMRVSLSVPGGTTSFPAMIMTYESDEDVRRLP